MRFFAGACPERHEILPLHSVKGQNDNKLKGLRMTERAMAYRSVAT